MGQNFRFYSAALFVFCVIFSMTEVFALQLVAAKSRKIHGAAGTFDIAIDIAKPITGAVTVEPRAIGTGHTIVFQFDSAISAAGTASAADANGVLMASVSQIVASGNDVSVTLASVPDNRRLTLSLMGVNGSLSVSVAIGFLIGDVDGNRLVDSTDVTMVQATSGQATNASNYKFDVNASGGINISDITAVRARVGFSIPIYPPAGYTYDPNGRLVGVTLGNDGARYSYDAAGNILSIARLLPTNVSVLGFTPSGGLAGSTFVSIVGTGFSVVPSSNIVSFNGASATVSAATPTKLSVQVPAGATTGLISVMSPNGSAASVVPFLVAAAASFPTVSSFSPTSGVIGTSVTVTGSGFGAAPSANSVTLNTRPVSLTSASTTSLTFTVPEGATSGWIDVSTVVGTASTNSSFIVLPPNGNMGTQMISIGGGAGFGGIGVSPSSFLWTFTDLTGMRLGISISLTNVMPPGSPLKWILTRPDGIQLFNSSTAATQFDIPIGLVPMTGTYSLLLDGGGTVSASAVVTVTPDLLTTIGFDQAPLSVNIAVPGQNAVLTFPGIQGSGYSLVASNFAGGNTYNVSVTPPSGTKTFMGVVSATQNVMPLFMLQETGPYQILIDPVQSVTSAPAFTLLADDSIGSISPGVMTPMAVVSGRAKRLSFPWSAPTLLGMTITVPSNADIYASLSDPFAGPFAFWLPAVFPGSTVYTTGNYGTSISGTYSVRAITRSTAAGSVSVRVGTQ